MPTDLLSVTALPNLHAAVVHFPIALLPAAVAVDALSLVRPRTDWLRRAATLLYSLGMLGAAAAYLAGRQAIDSVAVPPDAQLLAAAHSDWGLRTLALFIVVALLHGFVALKGRSLAAALVRALRTATFLLALVGLWSLVQTADRGGALVYQHGVAVATAATARPAATPPPPPTKEPAEPSVQLHKGPEGSLTWTPGPAGGAALGTLLKDSSGEAPANIEVVGALPDSTGLTLNVSGRAMLLFEDSFGNVELKAVVDPSGFSGVVGLLHHVTSADEWAGFEVEPGREARLVSISAGARRVLDSSGIDQPSDVTLLEIGVSAAGKHLKGTVGGATVAHGHEAQGGDGRVGLLLDGSGTIRIERLRVTPLVTH